MIEPASFIAVTGSVALMISGYLYGARRGNHARRALMTAVDQSATALSEKELLLAEKDKELARMEQQIADLTRQDISAKELRTDIQQVLEPFKLGRELAKIKGGTTLGELPQMLDAIAEKGGFSSVVLSDDAGLPLAANRGAPNIDVLAGAASYVLTMADRAERDGTPRPQAVVVLDQSNQHTLHRIFIVDARAYTLTAVARGVHVQPNALDAALGKLERVLAKEAA